MTQSYKTAPSYHIRCQFQVQIVTCASGLLAIEWQFQQLPIKPSLGLVNLVEQLTDLRETFYLLVYQFKNQMEEMHQARCEGMSSHALSKGTTLPKPPRVHQPRSSLNPCPFEFLWGLCYIRKLDWIISLVTKLNLQSFSPP